MPNIWPVEIKLLLKGLDLKMLMKQMYFCELFEPTSQMQTTAKKLCI